MEFRNIGLLPNGLPTMMYQVTPSEHRSDLRVNARARSGRRGLMGQADLEGLHPLTIKLFSLSIMWHAGIPEGTKSFSYWVAFLRVALHEIGHIVTHDVKPAYSQEQYEHDGAIRARVEQLADGWMAEAMRRIARDCPRLGQPTGPMKGLPGHQLYEWSQHARNQGGRPNRATLADYRAIWSGGQITLNGIIENVANVLGVDRYSSVTDRKWVDLSCSEKYEQYGRLYRTVCKAAKELDIDRAYVNRAGKRFRTFTHGEAVAVAERVRSAVHSGEYPLQRLAIVKPKEPTMTCQCGSADVRVFAPGYSFEEMICDSCGEKFDSPIVCTVRPPVRTGARQLPLPQR